MEVTLIRGEDCIKGIQSFTGVIKYKHLPNCLIPRYNSDTDELNYQRMPTDSRINKIRDRFLGYESKKRDINRIDKSALIDNINLNIRSDVKYHNLKLVDPTHQDEPGSVYKLNINPGIDAYIVDGQTRYLGLSAAIERLSKEGQKTALEYLENLHLNVSLTFAEDPTLEAIIFYMLNNYSKPLTTEGALRILYQGYKESNDLFVDEIGRQKNEEFLDTYEIAEKLNNDEQSIWYNLVADYNDQGAKKPIKMGIMAKRVVQPIFDITQMKSSDKTKVMDATEKTINAAWSGLKQVFPEPFNDYKSSGKPEYSMLKSSCAEAMSNFFAKVLEQAAFGNYNKKLGNGYFSPINPSDWAKLLEVTIVNFKDLDGLGVGVQSFDCWLAGVKGSVGRYTSQSAKKQLADKLFTTCVESYLKK